MKNKVISLVLLFTILFSNIVLAANTVTKEQLELGYINTFKTLEDEETKITDTKAYDDRVEFLLNGVKYDIKYILAENPTFTMEIPITKGISYKDYKKLEENFDINMYSYVTYANVNGVTLEDAKVYLAMALLAGLGNMGSINLTQGAVIYPAGAAQTQTGDNIFYEDTFGNDVIRYVNYMYKEKQSANDEKLLNSFTYEKWIENIDDSNCKVVSKLVIKKDFDFNKINDMIAKEKEDYEKSMKEKKAASDHVVQLKVGQKCKFTTVNKINGFSSMGGTVEFSEDKTEVTAKSAGDTYAEIMLENNITKKVYFEVLENTNNSPLEAITLVLQDGAEPPAAQEPTNTVTNTVTNTTTNTAPAPTPAPAQPQAPAAGTVTGAVTQGVNKLPNAGYHVRGLLNVLYVALVVLVIMLVVKIYKIKNEK